MFWRKKTDQEPVVAEAPTRAPELDTAIEGAASILRALAKHSFGVGEETAESVAQRLEQWASHLLVLAPPPGKASSSSVSSLPPKPSAPAPVHRDWQALARFVEAHRKAENVHVNSTTSSMRETIVTMLQCFRATSAGQGRTDEQIRAQLDALHAAVESGSVEALRARARAVAVAITDALESQREQSVAQTMQLRERLGQLQKQLDDAQRAGVTDPLTQLGNRRQFDTFIERTALLSSVTSQPMALLIFDVDHFKMINDTYGHPAGDAVLRSVADALARSFPRRSDIVARYGGEEFAVVLSETSLADAQRLANRGLDAIRESKTVHAGRTLSVSASGGVAVLLPGEDVADLIVRADQALYDAKRSGRDRISTAGLPIAKVA
jgi:diguanylate cyclase (GGDEF)-like protein